jgi:hypothetical protein
MKIWVTFVEALLDGCMRLDLEGSKGISWTWGGKLGLIWYHRINLQISPDVVCVMCSPHPEAPLFILP